MNKLTIKQLEKKMALGRWIIAQIIEKAGNDPRRPAALAEMDRQMTLIQAEIDSRPPAQVVGMDALVLKGKV